ncbi:hypothetical protein ElyMa_000574000 [Elysia marginata]|uniref:G-protein coupled receptors family 1 profile domain-containing protein n=1 Tax=Elysia marginata TaxID=1093978 RepID=A0AAV4G3T3_9GAST|nr:hypothetical protein ElyMa_000574000 [Elysia marginata]
MSNSSSNHTLSETVYTCVTIIVCADIVVLVLGGLSNGWLLASIMTSTTLRTRLRNQFICCLATVNILQELCVSSLEVIYTMAFILRNRLGSTCALYVFYQLMTITCNILADLLVLMIAVVFLAQVLDFVPESKFSPRYLRIGKIGLLAFPWAFAVVVGPPSLLAISSKRGNCLFPDYRLFYIIEFVFTVFPLCVASVIIGVGVVLRCTRFGRGNITAQGNMGVQLMGSGPEIDSSLAYIGAVVVCAATETLMLLVYFNWGMAKSTGWIFFTSADVLESARCVFLPLVFLFLTDIRERIKQWRPWRRDTQASGIDLTIAYNRED